MSDQLDGIAIIGMSGKFPGSENVNEFWENIKEGKDLISTLSDEELIRQGISRDLIDHSNYIKRAATISNIDKFDSEFFNFSPREADLTDPQHRLFLEHAWSAFEDAGYYAEPINEKVGVFGGTSASSYLLNSIKNDPDFIDKAGGIQAIMHGFDKDHLATKVSYKLNLTGPSINVQTACSSSLVATILACQSLLTYQCDMALAGGVTVNVPHKTGYMYHEGSVMSKDGFCKPFDDTASGTIFGSGVGIIVLKRLEEAINDNDQIYAVVKGFSMNNDGADKVGYTAPGLKGQSEVITEALEYSGINPDTVGYVEAHGTGTLMGDPIEVDSLTQTYRNYTDKDQYCAIGSVKANIGHLNAAAGVTGLIKTAMILQNKEIPPTINVVEANKEINLDNSPFYINKRLKKWTENDNIPRRAAVSSFGIGGTNSHLILEEAPNQQNESSKKSSHLLLWSARDEEDLLNVSDQLIDHLENNSNEASLPRIAKTLRIGRKHFPYRRAIACENITEAIYLAKNETTKPKRILTPQDKHNIVFMFPGQGTQYAKMAKGLYGNIPIFAKYLDQTRDILMPLLKIDIYEVLFGDHGKKLNKTWYTQPIMFAVEYSLARTLMKLGIKPDLLIGHSLGEYVAACVSGVFRLEDALHIIANRGLLMKRIEQGAMLAVFATKDKLKTMLQGIDKIDIAAINSPELVVVAGPKQEMKEFINKLEVHNINHQRLNTSHAFHSHMMDPLKEEFKKILEHIPMQQVEIPIVSNVTGNYVGEQGEDYNADYWINHLREPVHFLKGISKLQSDKRNNIYIEVGPGKVLTNLVLQHQKDSMNQPLLSFPSMNTTNSQQEYQAFLSMLGQLWTCGFDINWEYVISDEQETTISLPNYPFKRKVHWIGQSFEDQVEIATRITKGSDINFKQEEIKVHERPKLKSTYVTPESEVEMNLVDVWEQLLGIRGIGTKDNFFDLGGHSLMASQILSRIKEIYPIELTIEEIFHSPTIFDLANVIEKELIKLLETMSDEDAKKLL